MLSTQTFKIFSDNFKNPNYSSLRMLDCQICPRYCDIDFRVQTITAQHKAIIRKFNEVGLVIDFPQRDVILDTNAPLDILILGD